MQNILIKYMAIFLKDCFVKSGKCFTLSLWIAISHIHVRMNYNFECFQIQ